MAKLLEIIFVYPFAYLISYLYLFLKSYGLTLIVFTLIYRLLVLPLGIKQQKAMMKQAVLAPKIKKLKEQYKDDPKKLNEEQQKLYMEEGGMLGGCLPMLIQLPIMLILYTIIRNPLTYINSISTKAVEAIATVLSFDLKKLGQIGLQTLLNDPANLEKVKDFLPSTPGYEFLPINFNFLGLDLSGTPSIARFGWLWLIPLFAAATALLQALVSQKFTLEESRTGTAKTMALISPVLSLIISFTLPATLGFYWGISGLFGAVQTYFLGKKYDPNKYKEELMSEAERKKAEERRKLKEEKIRKYQERMAAFEEQRKKKRK